MKSRTDKASAADLPRRGRLLILCLAAALPLAMLLSLCLGRYPLSPSAAFGALFAPEQSGTTADIVRLIRLPRVCAAALCGAALSSAGLLFQLVFHHPMATPDLLGTSSGASFGAALGLLCGWSTAAVTVSGFAAGLLSVIPVILTAGKYRGRGTVTLILTGLVTGSLFSGAVSCIKLLADESNRLPAITYWLMGSLSGIRVPDVWNIAAVILPVSVLMLLIRYRLNLLDLNDDEAASLGTRIRLLRFACMLAAALLTAASVSVCGVIGWVGLFIPNLCRALSGEDTRTLLPCTMLAGGLFLLLADDVSRTLLVAEIPLGILTAAIGAPLFLVLYLKGRYAE
ncbi:MAG: iron ABC transporter permease [Clostridia bacterium]|nr:iron ABC transporter permease [Clostridia bacterium]